MGGNRNRPAAWHREVARPRCARKPGGDRVAAARGPRALPPRVAQHGARRGAAAHERAQRAGGAGRTRPRRPPWLRRQPACLGSRPDRVHQPPPASARSRRWGAGAGEHGADRRQCSRQGAACVPAASRGQIALGGGCVRTNHRSLPELEAALERVRIDGWARDEPDHEPVRRAVAAPVWDTDGDVAAAISLRQTPLCAVQDPDAHVRTALAAASRITRALRQCAVA